MIRLKEIIGFECRYHRNGVDGEGFTLCNFRWRLGSKWHDMRAVVFEGRGQIAVISESIGDKWRGDDFESAIRQAIAQFERTSADRMYSREGAAYA